MVEGKDVNETHHQFFQKREGKNDVDQFSSLILKSRTSIAARCC